MQKEFTAVGIVLCLLIFGWVSGVFDSDDGDAVENPFPEFSAVGDDGEEHTLDDYKGNPFIVLFSAEWCNTPCHATMHALNSTLNAPILVMSTDPSEEISLQDWHEMANSHDDEGNDTGQTLEIPFMKGISVAEDIGIMARPTVIFVDWNGGIVANHKGGLLDADEISAYWVSAGGTV